MTFSRALRKLRKGSVLTRTHWDGKMTIFIVNIPGGEPFIKMETTDKMQGSRWVTDSKDLLSDDWVVCQKK